MRQCGQKLGLDKLLITAQYLMYLGNLSKGDLRTFRII